MDHEHLIPVRQFCLHHQIEYAFIRSLNEFGLIEITIVEQHEYLLTAQMKDLEKLIRLHYDLDINMEGIDAIHHLLQRVDHLQDELNALRNRLRLYEEE